MAAALATYQWSVMGGGLKFDVAQTLLSVRTREAGAACLGSLRAGRTDKSVCATFETAAWPPHSI